MIIYCQHCAGEIPAYNIDFKRAIAKCDSCNNIFEIGYILDDLSSLKEDDSGDSFDKAYPQLPRGISLREGPRGLEISRRWLNTNTIILTIITLLFGGGAICFSFLTYKMYEPFTLVGAISFWLFAIPLSYICLAFYMNTTTITMSGSQLIIEHSPIPAPGVKALPLDDVKRIYTKERSVYGNGYTRIYYDSYIIQKGRHIKILSGLTSREQSLFIEEVMGRYLRLYEEG